MNHIIFRCSLGTIEILVASSPEVRMEKEDAVASSRAELEAARAHVAELQAALEAERLARSSKQQELKVELENIEHFEAELEGMAERTQDSH